MDQVREELVQIIKKVDMYDNDEMIMALTSKIEFYVIDKDDIDFEKCVELIRDDENVDEILRQVFEGKVKGAQAPAADQKEKPNASNNVLPSVQIIANDKKEESKLIDIDGLPNGVKRENGEEALSNMFSALLKDDQVREEIGAVMRNAHTYNDNYDLMIDIRDQIWPYRRKIPNFDFDKFIELIQNNNALDIFQRVLEENWQKERLNPSNNSGQMIASNNKEGLLNGISKVPKDEKKGNGEILYNISSVPLKDEKQNEITIIIKVSNPDFYEKLNKKKDDGTGYNFNLIMQNALNHINQMKKNDSVKTYFEKKDGEKQLFLFRIFEANKLESGAGKGIELLPDMFEYRLLPHTIQIIAKTDNESLLLKPQTKINVQLESEDYFGENEDINSEKENLYFRKFKCFLKFFQGKPYSLINKNSLEVATKKTIAKFNGIEPFMANFKTKMSLFSTKCYSTPKGILLFGPPGTGKSAITKTLCEELGVVFATAPMAAGDLKKGIVGDSEKTINEIAMRCKLVPWEMCVLLIDEIDSLAPDRTAENASTGSQDLIGVLLATLDGSKETKNMKIIASTNLLDKIDKAFLRRMEIQLFLGNPNKSSREAWIKAKIKQSQKDVNFERIRRFAEDEEFEELRNFVIYSTMNFSADAYRKLLDRFYHALLIFEPEPEPRSEYESESGSQYEGSEEYENLQLQQEPEYEDYKALLEKKILGVSEEMKIYLKGAPVLSVIKASDRLCYDDYYLEVLEDIAEKGGLIDLYGRKLKASCKALIDLSTERHKQRKSDEDNFQEVVQMPCKNETRLTSEEQEVLLQLKEGRNNQDKSRAASYYLFAILYFSGVEHLEENQTKYNIVRERVLKDQTVEIFTKLCSGNSIKTHLLDNPNSQIAKDCVARVLALTRGVNEQPHVLLEDFIQSVDLFYDPMPLKILQLLKDPKRYQHDWLPLIVKFALNYDADIVKMIDNSFIVNSSALDDSAATSLISRVISETKEYAKSVIIFDLDSISQIKKEYQSLKQDIEVSTKIAIERGDNEASFNYTLQRPQTFQTILDILRKVDSDSKCWFFAVSKHPKIVLDFKEALKWPKTPSVIKAEQEEIDKEKLYRCKHCPEIFNDRQNLNEYKCYRHTKHMVLFDDPKKPVGSTQKPRRMTLDQAYEEINKGQDIFEMHFRYVCCGTVLGGKGHEPHKHEKGEEIDLDSE